MDKPSTPGDSVTQEAADVAGADIDLTGKTLGDFHIRRRLGRGGMGQVYLAEQVSLHREVALKILRSDLAANKLSLDRFKSEATAVAKATHANIVQIYTINEAVIGSQLLHYIALEYIEGRNLREYLEKKGSPDILVGLSIMRQVGSALQRSSELGIVHRDIKPENILINRRGEVKVADFGLSRFADANRPANLTQTGVTMGTPLYMAPEQVELRPVDPRTDIYSFGVTCYHMFAGHPPFKGTSPVDVAWQQVNKEPQPLQEIRPDLPVDLCSLIQKMMAKRPEDRPQTSREIVREIVRLRDALVGVTTMGLTSSGLTQNEVVPTISTQTFPGLRRPFPWWKVVRVGAVVVALSGGLAWSYWQYGGSSHVLDVPLEEIGPSRKPSSDRDKELYKLVQEHNRPETRDKGQLYAIELGILYLRELRLEEADDFFQKCSRDYPDVSKLGSAMVHAFRAEADKSNQKFKEVLEKPKDKKDKLRDELRSQWRRDHAWREMIARALYHNKVNAPALFPAELDVWLSPPRPTIKPPPPTPTTPPAPSG